MGEETMKCRKCNGLMELVKFYDLGEAGAAESFIGYRCVNCGRIMDLTKRGEKDGDRRSE